MTAASHNTSLLALLDAHVEDGDEAALTSTLISLPAEQIPEILWLIMRRRKQLARLERVAEAICTANGLNEWVSPQGERFLFIGSQRHGFENIPDLFVNLHALGVSERDLASSVSEARITDLQAAIALITDTENRAAANALLVEHRVEKGARGVPHLSEVDRMVPAKKKEVSAT